jgi:hypothetical protein
MRITQLPLAALRLQYRITRLPMQLIENQVAARLKEDAPARLFLERSIGTIDSTVGGLLGDAEVGRRGAALVERSDTLKRAAELDATAKKKRRQADAEFAAVRDEAVSDINSARKATAQQTAEARVAAEDQKRAAEDRARERAANAKKQADDASARRKESAEAVKRRDKAVIAAGEQNAAKVADAVSADARAKRDEADIRRARAGQVEKLADDEKRRRQESKSKST